MCGRFETKPSLQSIIIALKKHKIEVNIDKELYKSSNIAPTDKILSLIYKEKNYNISLTNWGIKFSTDSPLIFNSRIETIKEKKYWTNLFDKNRSLVPMSAFYEWKKEGVKKIPYRIYLPDQEFFFVPALFHIDKNKNIFTSLITTTPNDFIKPIHHRMPVILKLQEGLEYLTNDADSNLNKCKPYFGLMQMEPADI